MKVALFQEFHSYIRNANNSIENLTNNDELETYDRQLLLIQHQPRLRTYFTVETEFEFFLVKQNTVEEFECSGCGKKVNLKSSIPVIKATTRPRSARPNFVALSFLVNRQYFKDYHKILGTLRLENVRFTQWIHIA